MDHYDAHYSGDSTTWMNAEADIERCERESADRERFGTIETPEARTHLDITCPICNVSRMVVSTDEAVLLSEGSLIKHVRVERRSCDCFEWAQEHRWGVVMNEYMNRIKWRAEERFAEASIYRRKTGEWPAGVTERAA